MNFPCPLPVSLTPVIPIDCPFRFDQIVKMLFFQRQVAKPFDTLAHMKIIATWTPLLASPADATTCVPTPIFSNFVIPDSAGKFVGGNDNTTFNGIPEYYGDQPVTLTGEFKNLQPATKVLLDALSPFSFASAVGKSNLQVMFVNKDGTIFHNALGGFDCYNWRIGSRSSQGLYTPDMNKFSFDLQAGWDANLATVTPTDFDALVNLVNVPHA